VVRVSPTSGCAATCAWEYKKRQANLDAAYRQLLTYRENLENPPDASAEELKRRTLTNL